MTGSNGGSRRFAQLAALVVASLVALGCCLNGVRTPALTTTRSDDATPWDPATPGAAGTASVVIIRTSPSGRFLLQRRSWDYPVKRYAGTLCLVGGNRNGIEGPWETMRRECREELPAPIADLVLSAAAPFKAYRITVRGGVLPTGPQSSLSEGPRPAYVFHAAVFQAVVGDAAFDRAANASRHASLRMPLLEGSLEVVRPGSGGSGEMAWGYGSVLEDFLRASPPGLEQRQSFRDPQGVSTTEALPWPKQPAS